MKWTTLMLAALLSPVCLGVPGPAAAGFPETAITIWSPTRPEAPQTQFHDWWVR
jgi:ABC-type glycerol-3-phosphate transport system substrate-binding protein